ncbi:MAG TPA: AmmeMemoRadiSam system radical SAM enzyme, partial [Spirochaetota bacterium]|nr:AmmeMemoRadiSam system radical SAM enzyme [Spirochaetota bacterium]
MPAHRARWFHPETDNRVRCTLCPRSCLIPDGKTGACRVRMNMGGELVALTWGRFPALAIDPIEKKPLYHFFPGSSTLSLGSLGCNMHCLHCQNPSLSDPDVFAIAHLEQAKPMPPEFIAPFAREHTVPIVAWTYNEPLVNAEYLVSVLPLVQRAGLKSVLVTAGLISPEPLTEILPHLDAWRIDIKGWGDEFYQRLTGFPGWKTVLVNSLMAKEAGCHIEVVTNIIDGWNDSPEMLASIAGWIAAELGAETPWHVTASHPAGRMLDLRPTPSATIVQARAIGLESGLKHVYCGNIDTPDGSDTTCPDCGAILIRRRGFAVL